MNKRITIDEIFKHPWVIKMEREILKGGDKFDKLQSNPKLMSTLSSKLSSDEITTVQKNMIVNTNSYEDKVLNSKKESKDFKDVKEVKEGKGFSKMNTMNNFYPNSNNITKSIKLSTDNISKAESSSKVIPQEKKENELLRKNTTNNIPSQEMINKVLDYNNVNTGPIKKQDIKPNKKLKKKNIENVFLEEVNNQSILFI